ncbi:MAG: hypothetical protein WD669_06595 [Pirellulales bacterium]
MASRAETGWATVVATWRSAVLDSLGWNYETIVQREPIEQAEYWLREVDAVLASRPESAELCIGAAWVLDSPGIDFMLKHVMRGPMAAGLGIVPDQEAIAAAKAQFEGKCAERCLSLAVRACELKPDEPSFWRMRALLLFDPDTNKPRDPAWLSAIDECARHDPDNALYDYLAARGLWTQSAEYDVDFNAPPDPPWMPKVHDAETFQRGVDRFELGQRKPVLAIGEKGLSAVAQFLKYTQLPIVEQDDVAVSRLVTFRDEILFYNLWRWQSVRGDAAEASNDLAGVVDILLQQQRLFEQATLERETSSLNVLIKAPTSFLDDLHSRMSTIAGDHPEIVGPAELSNLKKRQDSLQFEAAVWTKALQKQGAASKSPGNSVVIVAILVAACCIAVSALLAIAGICFVLALLLSRRRQEVATLGTVRQVIAWSLACSATLIVYGAAPAELISRPAQSRIIIVLAWCIVAAIIGFLLWIANRLLRRRNYQFSLLSVFGLMTAVAILVMAWPVWHLLFEGFASYPPERLFPTHGLGGIGGPPPPIPRTTSIDLMLWAAMQWSLHTGPLRSTAFAASIIALWFAWRTARHSNERFINYWTRDIQIRWAMLARYMTKSALAAAAVWLLIFFLAAPSVIRAVEDEFQYRMQYARNPAEHIKQLEAARAEILASPAEMKAIRESFGME